MSKNTDTSAKTTGAAVGGAVSVIVLHILAANGVDLGSGTDAVALGAGIATVVGTVWSWFLRDHMRDLGLSITQSAPDAGDPTQGMGPGSDPVPPSDVDDLDDDPDDGTAGDDLTEDGEQS